MTADLIFILFRPLVCCAGVRLSYAALGCAFSRVDGVPRRAAQKQELELHTTLVLLVATSRLGSRLALLRRCYGDVRRLSHYAQVPRFTAITKQRNSTIAVASGM